MLGKHALKPGEKTELTVSYETEGRPGPFEKKVMLATNIPGGKSIEIFSIKGEVLEAPGAKISVEPRRVTLKGEERAAGRVQRFVVKNEGSLPLVVKEIRSKDGKTVYFGGADEGALTVQPGQSGELELKIPGKPGEKAEREFLLVDSNARNAGASGLFLLIQYDAP